jgi:hypothetical protein
VLKFYRVNKPLFEAGEAKDFYNTTLYLLFLSNLKQFIYLSTSFIENLIILCYYKDGIDSELNCGVYRRVPVRDRFGVFYLLKYLFPWPNLNIYFSMSYDFSKIIRFLPFVLYGTIY